MAVCLRHCYLKQSQELRQRGTLHFNIFASVDLCSKASACNQFLRKSSRAFRSMGPSGECRSRWQFICGFRHAFDRDGKHQLFVDVWGFSIFTVGIGIGIGMATKDRIAQPA